jgi:hypothetical protein
MVPGAGLEPAHLAAGDFESCAKTSIGAGFLVIFSAKII